MKVKQLLLMVALFATLTLSAYANGITLESASIENLESGTVALHGKYSGAKASVKLLVCVLAKDRTLEEGIADRSLIAYTDEVTVTGQGEFTIRFQMDETRVSTGDYTAYLFGSDIGAAQSKDFYYTLKSDLDAILRNLKLDSSAANISAILGSSEKQLSLTTFVPYTSLAQTTALSKLVSNELQKQSDINTLTLDNFVHIIKKMSVIACLNESKSTVVSSADGQMSYESLLNLAGLDTGNGLAYYATYSTGLNSDGRKNVLKGLENKNFERFEDFYALYREYTFVQAVVNWHESGFVHVPALLAGNEFGLNLSKYNALTEYNKQLVCQKLVAVDAITAQQLQAKLDQLVDGNTPPPPQNTPTPPRGGSGGSGGYNFTVDAAYDAELKKAEQAPPNEVPVAFTDMADRGWAAEAVGYLSAKGIVQGTGTGAFEPDKMVTREEFVKMIVGALGVEAKGDASFSDVPANAWYYPYIAAAKNAGIINGRTGGEFGTGENITREECAAIISRALGNSLGDASAPVEFTDGTDISSYARGAVDALSGRGIINGMGDGTFAPQKTCTRAEAAVMIYNSIKKVIK